MWMKWDPIEYYFYCTLSVVLSWPEDSRSRPKHVAKYNLILIIASCLDVCCVLTVLNVYKFDNTQRDGISQIYGNSCYIKISQEWGVSDMKTSAQLWYRPHMESKAVPLQAWSGPVGSRKLTLPDFMTTAQDIGKVLPFMPLPPRKCYWYSFLLEAESTPGFQEVKVPKFHDNATGWW